MGNKLLIIIIFVFFGFLAKAQDIIEVTIEQKEMSMGEQTAISVLIPETNVKLVENEWKKFINERPVLEFVAKGTSQTFEKAFIDISNLFSKDKREFTKNKLKVTKVNNELIVKNVLHEEVTNNHIDVYAIVNRYENGVKLSSFFRFSDSIFINKSNVNENTLLAFSNYLKLFGQRTYIKAVEQQLFNERRELRNLEGELKMQENKNKSMHSSIGRQETNIDECENTIRIVEKVLEKLEDEIAENKNNLRRLDRKTETYTTQKDLIKQLEKEHKKEYTQIKTQNSRIKRYQSRIRNLKADISVNLNDQDIQKKKIEEQKAKLNATRNKLNEFKNSTQM